MRKIEVLKMNDRGELSRIELEVEFIRLAIEVNEIVARWIFSIIVTPSGATPALLIGPGSSRTAP
jgi:hypothetical protein